MIWQAESYRIFWPRYTVGPSAPPLLCECYLDLDGRKLQNRIPSRVTPLPLRSLTRNVILFWSPPGIRLPLKPSVVGVP